VIFKIEKVTKRYLKPIAVNFLAKAPKSGAALKVIGMGAIDRAGTVYRDELRHTTVYAMSKQSCAKRYGTIYKGDTMLCAQNFAQRSGNDLVSTPANSPFRRLQTEVQSYPSIFNFSSSYL